MQNSKLRVDIIAEAAHGKPGSKGKGIARRWIWPWRRAALMKFMGKCAAGGDKGKLARQITLLPFGAPSGGFGAAVTEKLYLSFPGNRAASVLPASLRG